MPDELKGPGGAKRREAAGAVFTDPAAYATCLVTVYLDEFGPDALLWHPHTAKLEVEENFGVTLTEANFGRLMAGVAVLTTDCFYKNVNDFMSLCRVMAGGLLDPGVWVPAAVEEVAWGVTEALLLSPPDDDDQDPFSAEIRAYVGAVLDDEGFLKAPDVLGIAARRGGDPYARVRALYADSPDLLAAVEAVEEAKAGEVTGIVRDNLRRLLVQMSSLPLANGDPRELIEKLAPEAMSVKAIDPATGRTKFLNALGEPCAAGDAAVYSGRAANATVAAMDASREAKVVEAPAAAANRLAKAKAAKAKAKGTKKTSAKVKGPKKATPAATPAVN